VVRSGVFQELLLLNREIVGSCRVRQRTTLSLLGVANLVGGVVSRLPTSNWISVDVQVRPKRRFYDNSVGRHSPLLEAIMRTPILSIDSGLPDLECLGSVHGRFMNGSVARCCTVVPREFISMNPSQCIRK
jgi:hypothetical protein